MAIWSTLLLVLGGQETIQLGSGARLEGTVVKETADQVFVDLGYTILGIPVKDIVRRAPVEAATGGARPAEQGNGAWIEGGEAAERSVRELAERLGSAVVLVACPGKMGSGFFISPQGHVITNCHVVEGERKITLTVFEKRDKDFEKRKVDKVKILALNPYYDLALLQVEDLEGLKFVPSPLGAAARLAVGERVFAIGNPMGLERTVTEGIVSTLARPFEGLTYIQTTTQINPGNSGGPLFNLRGEVVGVTNMKAGFFSEGLGFAIPVERVKELLRNREAFAFDADHPNTGYRYLPPPRRPAPPAGKKPEEKQ
jgi:serine protease Do